MMKKGLLFLVVLSLFLAGCVNIPSKVTGPKWTTKMTLPLVFRVRNSDGSTNTEWRLDGEPNGVGEAGADLTGDGSSVYAPGGEIAISGGSYGCIEINSFSDTTGVLPSGTIPGGTKIDFADDEIYGTITGYSSFLTSGLIDNGGETLNTLSVQINGGTAGVGGVTISVNDNGADTRQDTINSGNNSTNIVITNFELSRGIKISFSGEIGTPGSITVTLSKLQIGTMVVKGSAIASFPNNTIPINQDQKFDMSGLVNSSMHIKSCDLNFRIQDMPANLKINAYFNIEGYNSNDELLFNESHSVTPLSFQNSTSQLVSLPINNNVSYLMFKMVQVSLDAVDPLQDISIDGTQTLNFSVRPQLSLQSEVQAFEDGLTAQNPIQDIAFKIRVTNNTRLGYEINLLLSPNPNPTSDPNVVKLTFRIDPSPAHGQAHDTIINTMKLTAQDMAYLTSGQKVYNQMEITDLSTGKVLTNPYPYLEIRASVTLSILINNNNK